MLETHCTEDVLPAAGATAAADPLRRYCGPDRRRARPNPRDWLGAALDELDHGVVLLSADGEILHANQVAAAGLDAGRPLRRAGRRVQAVDAGDAAKLHDALRNAAQRRLRKLIFLAGGGDPVGVAVVPLGGGAAADDDDAAAAAPVLLVLGRREVCEPLTVQGYAAHCQLTGAEARVLGALCSGLSPSSIAAEIGVAISTVRTHIGTLRVKTAADSIRALVAKVARLPPLRSALRPSPAARAALPSAADEGRRWRVQ